MDSVSPGTWVIVITLVCTVLSAVIMNTSHRRSVEKEAKEEGRSNGVVLTELGYIRAGIDDVKRKQHDQDKEYVEMKVMVAQIDSKANAAHDRLDALEHRLNTNNNNNK